ncbi:MAG: family transcriptional regulator, partial [Solirubrobacterales bacterium]|nr:family transcriptional regulator [Solirubrobacterales bacterium]
AGRWLMRAGALAPDDAERAAVLGVRGMALADRAHHEAAMHLLRESIAAARRCGDERQAAWSLAILGRSFVLCGRLAEAVAALDESLALVTAQGWVAFQPLPESLRAEAALGQGELDVAAALLDHAFSLGCRLGDPCWEALSARARGLVHEAEGERDEALACLREAARRAVRVPDPYVWIEGHCLDALAGVAIADGAADAREVVDQLARLAARGDMRELVVRAALHRAALGDPDGAATARLLGEAIDNPVLHAELLVAR